MKLCALLALLVLAGPVAAKPVHIALKSSATVSANADGFFTLGSVADVTGGETALRTRLSTIVVGRAPLSGETRRLTRGDLSLKLRQAGCDPNRAVVLEGAETAEVSTADLASPSSEGGEKVTSVPAAPSSPTPSTLGVGTKTSVPLIHRGDSVTIVIQSGPLTINAPGIARENGVAGQSIRVHREGVMTDLTVQVLDVRTVQLEI